MNPLDLSDDYFRIRLVCNLLETCGMYYDKGAAKKKLDFFLTYFQVCRSFMRLSLLTRLVLHLHERSPPNGCRFHDSGSFHANSTPLETDYQF